MPTSDGSSANTKSRSTRISGRTMPSARLSVAAKRINGRARRIAEAIAEVCLPAEAERVVKRGGVRSCGREFSADHGAAQAAVVVAVLGVAGFQHLRLGKLRFSFGEY